MKIEKLTIDSQGPVVSLFARVVSFMRETGIDQWDELYPDGAVLEDDLRSGCAYGLFADEQKEAGTKSFTCAAVHDDPAPRASLNAYIVVNRDQPDEYRSVPWNEPDAFPLVIHRLCVDPEFRGQGAAKELLSFAEAHARAQGLDSIRLDAFSLNPAALSLYESFGYERRGEVRFRKGRFFCYEKSMCSPFPEK